MGTERTCKLQSADKFEPKTFLLCGDSSDYYTTMPPYLNLLPDLTEPSGNPKGKRLFVIVVSNK